MGVDLTYSKYLNLDRLLNLQQPRSEGPAHDETLFIIIHQIYELWFNEILHELDHVTRLLRKRQIHPTLHFLDRIIKIFKILVEQLGVLKTINPVDFLTFRGYLGTASAFQSRQFRELEFLMGFKRQEIVHMFEEGSEARKRLELRLSQPCLREVFIQFLSAEGYPVPEELLAVNSANPLEPSDKIQQILIDIYHDNQTLTLVCERLLDIDDGFQEWRYNHVKLVERTIGEKPGTGGSSGVKYLKTTLFNSAFPDLRAIRTRL